MRTTDALETVVRKLIAQTQPRITAEEFDKLSPQSAYSILTQLAQETRAETAQVLARWPLRAIRMLKLGGQQDQTSVIDPGIARPFEEAALRWEENARLLESQLAAEPMSVPLVDYVNPNVHRELEETRALVRIAAELFTFTGFLKLTLCASAEIRGGPIGSSLIHCLWVVLVPRSDRAVIERDLQDQYLLDACQPWVALMHFYLQVSANIRWFAWGRVPRIVRLLILSTITFALLSAIARYR